MSLVKQFNDYRSKMNEKILAGNNLVIKRIFNLDTNAYAGGSLDTKTIPRLEQVRFQERMFWFSNHRRVDSLPKL